MNVRPHTPAYPTSDQPSTPRYKQLQLFVFVKKVNICNLLQLATSEPVRQVKKCRFHHVEQDLNLLHVQTQCSIHFQYTTAIAAISVYWYISKMPIFGYFARVLEVTVCKIVKNFFTFLHVGSFTYPSMYNICYKTFSNYSVN